MHIREQTDACGRGQTADIEVLRSHGRDHLPHVYGISGYDYRGKSRSGRNTHASLSLAEVEQVGEPISGRRFKDTVVQEIEDA